MSVLAGGAYVATNIVPACRKCNASKASSSASDWLTSKFDQQAEPIMGRIEGYFALVRSEILEGL